MSEAGLTLGKSRWPQSVTLHYRQHRTNERDTVIALIINENDRFSRQANIIHDDLMNAVVLLVGTGMLGGWTAQALARCTSLVHIVDGDTVEAVNSGNQPYNALHAGQPKVGALAGSLTGFPVAATHDLFDGGAFTKDRLLDDDLLTPGHERKLIVVSGVDSFVPRGQLAEWARDQGADVFVDTRALGNTAAVFIVPNTHIQYYLDHEMMDDADTPELPCGFNGTAGVGMYVASQVYSYLNSYFAGLPVPFAQVTDLQLMEYTRRDALPVLEGVAA